MKEKDFDTRLKNALQGLEAPYDPGSWDMLAGRLDAPFTEESPAAVDPVDKAVYHTLQQLEAPYQSRHWHMLAARLADIRRTRARLWASKAAELVILLLLLLNLRGFWSEKAAPPATRPKPSGPVAEAVDPNYAPASRPSSPASASPWSAALPALPTTAAWSGLPDADAMHTPLALPAATGVDMLAAASAPALTASIGPFAALAAGLLPFAWSADEPLLPASARVATTAQKPVRSRFYFASYTGLDRNQVQTDELLRRSGGFHTGFALGYRPGIWGIEAGVAYSHKQYAPKKRVEIYAGNVTNGYFGTYLAEIDADVVSVPVKVTRRVAKAGNTSLHAVAGATANFAAQKTYRYQTVQFPGATPPNQAQSSGAQPQLRQTGRGVLENGKLAENAFFTADLGLRIEQPLGGRWTVFVEPAYRQALSSNDLGPHPSRISTFSVQAGVVAGL